MYDSALTQHRHDHLRSLVPRSSFPQRGCLRQFVDTRSHEDSDVWQKNFLDARHQQKRGTSQDRYCRANLVRVHIRAVDTATLSYTEVHQKVLRGEFKLTCQ